EWIHFLCIHHLLCFLVAFAGHSFVGAVQSSRLALPQFGFYPVTSMPMLRAVPATMRNAVSSFVAFRSFSLSFTMSITCFFVTFPTFSLFGALDPVAMPAA